MGIVEYIGNAVSEISTGDYVVVPDGVHNGSFEMTPVKMEWYAGHSGGAQYESLICFLASRNTLNSTREIDYFFVGDIFATGWAALNFAGFEPGDTNATFGAGPVGLLATHSAQICGTSMVYVVDYIPGRLALAASIGAVPIDFTESDLVEQILALEPKGVRRSVGYEAVNATLDIENGVVIRNMIAVTGNNEGMGVDGVYENLDDIGENRTGIDIPSHISSPIAEYFDKGLI
ncbi:hypothetical protein QQZ08_006847 [Neonectria magnoliae]|uniref:Uncharacterized protein n=1 Tax=Neonectria magnoliae TaxID=2732573 RepID=A0ABR1HZK2_9HYPO